MTALVYAHRQTPGWLGQRPDWLPFLIELYGDQRAVLTARGMGALMLGLLERGDQWPLGQVMQIARALGEEDPSEQNIRFTLLRLAADHPLGIELRFHEQMTAMFIDALTRVAGENRSLLADRLGVMTGTADELIDAAGPAIQALSD